jgi:hypothetical protein
LGAHLELVLFGKGALKEGEIWDEGVHALGDHLLGGGDAHYPYGCDWIDRELVDRTLGCHCHAEEVLASLHGGAEILREDLSSSASALHFVNDRQSESAEIGIVLSCRGNVWGQALEVLVLCYLLALMFLTYDTTR